MLLAGLLLYSVFLLHCVVGWLVIVLCVPSTLCCGLLVCVMSPFYTVLFVGLCSCRCFIVLLVDL